MDSTNDSANPASNNPGLPIIRLSDDGEHVIVMPHHAMPNHAVEVDGALYTPLHLPRVSKSLTDWCALLGERFYREHGRCIAMVLILEFAADHWGAAIPTQRCAATASCWSAARNENPGFPPHGIIAGSFQTRILSPGEAPVDCPPPHDGLHFVQMLSRSGQPQKIWSFLRAGDNIESVPASTVIVDDLQEALQHAMPRLMLA